MNTVIESGVNQLASGYCTDAVIIESLYCDDREQFIFNLCKEKYFQCFLSGFCYWAVGGVA